MITPPYKNLIVLSILLLAPLGYTCGHEGALQPLHDDAHVAAVAPTETAEDWDDIDGMESDPNNEVELKKPDINDIPPITDEEIRDGKVALWFSQHNLLWVLKYYNDNPKKAAAIAAAVLIGTGVSIKYLVGLARQSRVN